MWLPRDGRIPTVESGASRPRTSSAQTPVALTTTRARTSIVRPASWSTTHAPRTLPSVRSSSDTFAWFTTTAPARCAVRTADHTSRASSVRASQNESPRDGLRSIGDSSVTSRLRNASCLG